MKRILFLRKAASEGAQADFLYFKAQGQSTIALAAVGSPSEIGMLYSTNGISWQSYTIGTTINVADGEMIYFRASHTNNTFSVSSTDYYQFQGTGSFRAGGDLMYLLSRNRAKQIMPSYCFTRLFAGFPLKTPPEIWERAVLGNYCLSAMFDGCTALTQTMRLPFTTLAQYCYSNIYHDCTGLTTAQPLPAVSPAQGCYRAMFDGCTALTTPPIIELLTNGRDIMSDMFRNCTSLQSAPELKMTDINHWNSQFEMFKGCTSLAYIKVHFAAWATGSVDGTRAWVNRVSGSGIFECPSSLAEEYGESRIPTNFTRVTF